MGPDVLCYLLSDHLGGRVEVLVEREHSVRDEVLAVRRHALDIRRGRHLTRRRLRRRYTGQQQEPDDPALGLYNYKARFYSTTLGGFASTDPYAGSPIAGEEGASRSLFVDESRLAGLIARAGAPRDLSRLAYAAGNPVRYADADGFCFTGPWTGKMQPCSPEAVLGWLVCAGGWSRCSSSLQSYARWATRTMEFLWSHALNNPYYLASPATLALDTGDKFGFFRAYQAGLAFSDLNELAMVRIDPRLGERLLNQVRRIPKVGDAIAAVLGSSCFQGIVGIGALTVAVVGTSMVMGPGLVTFTRVLYAGAIADLSSAYFVAGSSLVITAGANQDIIVGASELADNGASRALGISSCL